MEHPPIDDLRRLAGEFRDAIERSRAEKASPHLPYFPDGACKMASWLFAMHLRRRGEYSIRFVTGHVPGFDPYVRHAWLVVDGEVVDLTADPFGEPPVVVGPPTPFHESLGELEEQDAATAIGVQRAGSQPISSTARAHRGPNGRPCLSGGALTSSTVTSLSSRRRA